MKEITAIVQGQNTPWRNEIVNLSSCSALLWVSLWPQYWPVELNRQQAPQEGFEVFVVPGRTMSCKKQHLLRCRGSWGCNHLVGGLWETITQSCSLIRHVDRGTGEVCRLSSQLAKTNIALVSHNSLTLPRTVIRYWFGLTRARRSSGLLSQPTVWRSVFPGASWGLLCKLYFSAVAALRRAAPWMLNGGSPFSRHIV